MVGSVLQVEDEHVEMIHGRYAQNTRKVSGVVVADVIRFMWHNEQGGNNCVPVDMSYLSKLCDACFRS